VQPQDLGELLGSLVVVLLHLGRLAITGAGAAAGRARRGGGSSCAGSG
jgi:hypothetical protein